MNRFSGRAFTELSSQQRLLKDHLSKVQYFLLSENFISWDDIDPKVMEEWNKHKNDTTWVHAQYQRELKKKEESKRRKKDRIIKW